MHSMRILIRCSILQCLATKNQIIIISNDNTHITKTMNAMNAIFEHMIYTRSISDDAKDMLTVEENQEYKEYLVLQRKYEFKEFILDENKQDNQNTLLIFIKTGNAKSTIDDINEKLNNSITKQYLSLDNNGGHIKRKIHQYIQTGQGINTSIQIVSIKSMIVMNNTYQCPLFISQSNTADIHQESVISSESINCTKPNTGDGVCNAFGFVCASSGTRKT